MIIILITKVDRIGAPILGYIIPALILLVAVGLTWMLYRRFSKPH